MKKTAPCTGPHQGRRTARRLHPISTMIILIMLAESAALVYFYAKFHAQNLMDAPLRDKLARLEKGVAEKERVILGLKQRLSLIEAREKEAKDDGVRKEQIAAYLRKSLKESKEMEMQMQERIEELSRKESGAESRTAQSISAKASGAPIRQDIPPGEKAIPEALPSSGEITGQVLIRNDKYNFIILNVGSDDGIEAGDEGAIECDGVQVGRAKVKKIYNKMCLADIMESSRDAKVEKNSLVKFTRAPGKAKS